VAPAIQLGTPLHFHTLDEARTLAGALARLAPEPGRVELGLTELMINAVEHGNLEIGNTQKCELQRADAWHAEIERRLATAPYKDRVATARADSGIGYLAFTIRDAGPGFDPTPYLDDDPSRLMQPNGRGIFLANRLSFDELRYSAGGRCVTATVFTGP
jgi:anti-sigma regulatory factor (Ser/Thr protein kinase)